MVGTSGEAEESSEHSLRVGLHGIGELVLWLGSEGWWEEMGWDRQVDRSQLREDLNIGPEKADLAPGQQGTSAGPETAETGPSLCVVKMTARYL